jgi:hypothetical protein
VFIFWQLTKTTSPLSKPTTMISGLLGWHFIITGLAPLEWEVVYDCISGLAN